MKESELMRKLHNGDKEAAGLIIERYYADIYRFCLYMVQSKEDAYDITQESFLKFIKYGTSYHHQNLKGYLLMIARNLCFDYFRDKKVTETSVGWEELDKIPKLGNQIKETEDIIYLQNLLKALSSDIREVVVLRMYEEMGDSEIKNLLERANAQVHIDEARKKKAHQAMMMEMEKQKINKQRIEMRMSFKNILLQQFYYMDKLFFYIYGGLICLGIIFIAVLQYTGVSQNEIITVCMAGAGILSITSIGVIDKMFFGKMAELGASCYFNTKQCVAAWMVMSGMINVVVLFLLAGYLNGFWRVGLLQVGLYILTPYLLSGMIALDILSMETGKKHSFLFVISGFLMSIGYGVLGAIPGIMYTAANRIWIAVFILSLLLFVIQIKRLFNKMEKGDVLCMN